MTPCVSSGVVVVLLPRTFSLLKMATRVVEIRNTTPQKNKKSAPEETKDQHCCLFTNRNIFDFFLGVMDRKYLTR